MNIVSDETVRAAICKECLRSYLCPIIYTVRSGKNVAILKTFWCSKTCSGAYNRRVRAK